MAGRRAVLAAVLFAMTATLCSAITFDLGYGQQKCFTEDLPPESNIRGSVRVGSSGGTSDMRLDVYVTNPSGVVSFHKADVNAVKFSFKSGTFEKYTAQAHRVCIMHQVDHRSSAPRGAFRRVTLEIDVATSAPDPTINSLASRQHADKLQQHFHEVSADINRLIETMDELRVGEGKMTSTNSSTSRLILRISVLACLLTVVAGALNVMALKSFFKQKKLA